MVADAYRRTAQSEDWAELKPLVEDVGLSIRVPDWMEMTRELLPVETARMDQMLDLITTRPGRRTATNIAASVAA